MSIAVAAGVLAAALIVQALTGSVVATVVVFVAGSALLLIRYKWLGP